MFDNARGSLRRFVDTLPSVRGVEAEGMILGLRYAVYFTVSMRCFAVLLLSFIAFTYPVL